MPRTAYGHTRPSSEQDRDQAIQSLYGPGRFTLGQQLSDPSVDPTVYNMDMFDYDGSALADLWWEKLGASSADIDVWGNDASIQD